MHLISIIAKNDRCPADNPDDDTPLQALTAKFGKEFPIMLCERREELVLRDLHPSHFQVEYRRAHPRDSIGFRVDLELCWAPREHEAQKVREMIRQMVLEWFDNQPASADYVNITVNIKWSQSRGFSRSDGTFAKW